MGISRRHSMAVVVALTGGLIAIPAGSASATNPGSESGDKSVGCGVDWQVESLQDPDEKDMPEGLRHYNGTTYDYGNSGFVREVNDQVFTGHTGYMEIQHYLTGSGDTSALNFRLPIATKKTILNAQVTLTLPDGLTWTQETKQDYAAWINKWKTEYSFGNVAPSNVSLRGNTIVIDLGTLRAGTGRILNLTAPVSDATARDSYIATARLTGAYLESGNAAAGCAPTTPPARETPALGTCQVALTGRTIRSLTAPDVEQRIKDSALPGETNADSWGDAMTASSWRIYGATDVALTDVTFTAEAVSGLTFDAAAPVKVLSPGGGALPVKYRGAVSGVGTPVVSADGKTVSVTIASMPTGSSVSLNLTGRPDGTGKQMIIDETLVGTSTDCTAGGPAPTVETQATESGPDCATTSVTVTTVTTTTRNVFDSRTGRWVPAEPEKVTSTSTRPLTPAQAAACAPTTQPTTPPVVTPPVVVTPPTKPSEPTTPPVKPADPVVTPPAQPGRPTPTIPPRDTTTRPGSTVRSAPRMVTRTFQVDRYMPKTAAQARLVARLDDDGRLRFREDKGVWGASRWQFVTVTVPADATKAQVVKAVNRKTSASIGDVRTTSRLATIKPGRSVVVAWELGKGATTKNGWGAKKNVNQTFLARS